MLVQFHLHLCEDSRLHPLLLSVMWPTCSWREGGPGEAQLERLPFSRPTFFGLVFSSSSHDLLFGLVIVFIFFVSPCVFFSPQVRNKLYLTGISHFQNQQENRLEILQ